MSQSPQTIAIIGAGFSGTVVAAHLLRQTGPIPLRVVLINRSGRLARGVAYGTRLSHHVLNVPAGRMSAFVDDEDDFLRFARQCDPSVTGGTFVPRPLYGDYLEHILRSAQAGAQAGAVLGHRADEVRDLTPLANGRGVRVSLEHGEDFNAAAAIIAAGNYTPANPSALDAAFLRSSRYVRDPWAPGALSAVPCDAPVLLIGTGLTMVDVALDLIAAGRSAPLIAISRRGLLPQPHRSNTSPPSYSHLPPELVGCEASAVGYLRAVRRHVRQVAVRGVDWRDVVASLRPVTPRLWTALSATERARFLRHLRPYWDAHRHRLAPALAESLQRAIATGALRTTAARLVAVAERGDCVEVRIRRRGAVAEETLSVGAVVNCTGPESDVRAIDDPLLRALFTSGVAVPDESGLGLELTREHRLVGRSGQPAAGIYLTGPLLKGTYWEATAVPELRVHAARVAADVLTHLSSRGA